MVKVARCNCFAQLVLLAGLLAGAFAPPANAAEPPKRLVREIYVPFANLNVLLENQPRRVLLSRQEYEELLGKAKLKAKPADGPPPNPVVMVAADYEASAEEERVKWLGRLTIDVLEDGLHAVPLDLSGVGLRSAKLDEQPAAIGRGDDGRLTLFVEGKGRRQLVLEMVSPLETTAAQQVLSFRLPHPPTAKFRLSVPGDVEIKSGASVVSRTVDEANEAARVTRFELMPAAGDTALLMTLNSRLKRRDRAVIARSVFVDEVTESYERLHATISLSVLYQAVDQFRFVVPAGFEVTEVTSPLLSRWAIEQEPNRRVLDVRLREPTVETVVVNLTAMKSRARPGAVPDKTGKEVLPTSWSFPRFEPLDVLGQMSVVGVLAEERLNVEAIAAKGLIPIDTSVLTQAMPITATRDESGDVRLRGVAAYYAPRADFQLSARFVRPAAEIRVESNVLLVLAEQGQQARGGFLIEPVADRLFAFDVSVPAGWHLTRVATQDGKPLAYERFGATNEAGRIRVRLPQGVAPGQECRVHFEAVRTPAGWLADWTSTETAFPVFAVLGAARDVGAIAIDAHDDMLVRPETLDRLTPLDEEGKRRYALGGVASSLAYRYEGGVDEKPYSASLVIERTRPRITARTFSFIRVEPDALAEHAEIIYTIEEAKTRQLSLSLPLETPAALSIRALDGVKVKEYTSQPAGKSRRWKVALEEPHRGTVRLTVDFQQPLPVEKAGSFSAPLVRAEGVAHQSGLVAVEGSAELDVQVVTNARAVDVGELAEAAYQPGRRLLGAFGFTGEPPTVQVNVVRHPGYSLQPAIVETAELRTTASANGVSQTAATFRLRTKVPFLEIVLPEQSELWSVFVDGKPVKPQKEGEQLLVSLPSAPSPALRELKLWYETPIGRAGLTGNIELAAPRLALRAERDAQSEEVPLADLEWRLTLPTGYEVIRSRGTVAAELERQEPAALVTMAGTCYAAMWTPLLGGRAVHSFASGSAATATKADTKPEAIANRERVHGADEQEYLMQDDVRYSIAREPSEDAVKEDPFGAAAVKILPPMAEAKSEEAAQQRPADMPPLVTTQPTPPPVASPPAAKSEPMPDRRYQLAKPQYGGYDPFAGAQNGETQGRTVSRTKLTGVGSLRIDESEASGGQTVTFTSLGEEPRLVVTVADRPRWEMLGWAFALAVALVGFAITGRSPWVKTQWILTVVAVGTFLPMIPGLSETIIPMNMVVYAAMLLVVFYLLVGFARLAVRFVVWLASAIVRRFKSRAAVASAAILLIAMFVAPARAEEPLARKDGRYVVQVVEPPAPVTVPDDAVILPYDPDSKTGIQDAGKLMVPYAKYVELWNLAYPDKKLESKAPPAPFSLAGATYSTTLEANEYLLLNGRLEIDVFADETVSVPFGLAGGVLAKADLDGKPARLQLAQPLPAASKPEASARKPSPNASATQPAAQAADARPADEAALLAKQRHTLVLQVSGKGRHVLDLAVRLKLERRGGWQVVEGVLPAAPATALSIIVPQLATEVRLSEITDRRSYDTQSPGQRIETALLPGGAIGIQWRPKVAQGQVDQGLTAHSAAVLDVQEDGLRLFWQTALEFRRSQRDVFRVDVPIEYLVEKVEGGNVRGWDIRKEGGRQSVEITLLKTARDAEQFALRLWRPGAVGQDDLAEFDAPVVNVADAAMQSGSLTIRRSPLLDVRTVSQTGLKRDELSSPKTSAASGAGAEDSPLGIRPYEAYQFASTPFALRLSAAAVAGRTTAEVQTVFRISEFDRELDSRVKLDVRDRPVHRVEVFLPGGFRLSELTGPGEVQWSMTHEAGRERLAIYLATGQQGEVSILVRGKLPADGKVEGQKAKADATASAEYRTFPLPVVEVRDVQRQEGDIAVQVDPGFDASAVKLVNCEVVARERLAGWLKAEQYEAAPLALRYRGPDYSGLIRLVPRRPIVHCERVITNVRVTPRAIEETILMHFNMPEAGIREVAFLLPESMRDSRIRVPMLRQKTVTPVAKQPWVQVRLELQGEVRGTLSVVVENDRLVTADSYAAPIPRLAMGDVRPFEQFVVLQNAGRDEIVVESAEGLETIDPQQPQWRTLSAVSSSNITKAYTVQAAAAQLVFKTRSRATLATAGARIAFAETNLVLDSSGGYRAEQIYKVDNTTEQFMEIELPEGSRLWTAHVAGEPVKPTEVPDANDPLQVRIPLVKTAAGDQDYAVVLKYGGRLPQLRTIGRVRFPLVHTRKINVEQSRVRLYLPDSHRWFDFGGTMRQAASEGELAEGQAAYETKKVQRLLATYRSGDEFAKIRASNNLKVIVDSSRSMGRGDGAAQQFSDNRSAIREAEQELLQRGEQATKAPASSDDNRARLNALFESQNPVQSRNAITGLGRNWDVSEAGKDMSGEARDQDGRFNAQWLNKSQLENPVGQVMQDEGEKSRPMAGKKPLSLKGRGATPQDDGKFRGPGIGSGSEHKEGKPAAQPAGERAPSSPKYWGDQGKRSGGQQDVLERYKEQLEQQSQPMPAAKPSLPGLGMSGPGMHGPATPNTGMPSSSMPSAAMPSAAMPSASMPGASMPGAGMPGAAMPGAAMPGAAMPGAGMPGAAMPGSGPQRPIGGQAPAFAIPQGNEFAEQGGAEGQPPAGATAAPVVRPSGLASIDFTVPKRGEVFYFTTPRGDIELTALAASNEMLARWGRAGIAILSLLIVLGLATATRRGAFDWLATRTGSILLIVAGLLMLLLSPLAIGLFVLGVVALVSGFTLAIRRQRARTAVTAP